MDAQNLLFDPIEIESFAPASTLTDDEIKMLEAATLEIEAAKLRLHQLAEAESKRRSKFGGPLGKVGDLMSVDQIAAAIGASKTTALKIISANGITVPIKRRGHFAKRQPIVLTPPLRDDLMRWAKDNRGRRCS